MSDGRDMIAELGRLLDEAGAVMDIDLERDVTLSCFQCGENVKPRRLIDMYFTQVDGKKRKVTRPFCEHCEPLARKIWERQVDARTIHRLHLQLAKAFEKIGVAERLVSLLRIEQHDGELLLDEEICEVMAKIAKL